MVKAVKWAAGILGCLTLAVIAVVYVLLSRIEVEKLKPRIVEMVFQSTGRRLSIDGRIDLAVGLTPSLIAENVRLANVSWGSRPDMVLLKRLEVKAALLPLLSRRVEILRLVLVEPDILIETSSRGANNLTFRPQGPVALPAPQAPQAPAAMGMPALALNNVSIEKGRLLLRDGKSGQVHELLLSRLSASGKNLDEPLSLDADLAYNGQAIAVKADLGSIATFVDPSKPWPVTLSVKAPVADLKLDGSVRDPLTGQGIQIGVDLKSGNLAALVAVGGQTLDLPMPLSLSGKLKDKGPKAFVVQDLNAVWGPNDIAGSVTLDLKAKRPRVTADLSSRFIDLNTMAQGDGVPAPAGSGRKLFPDTAFDLAGLKKVDAQLRAAFDRIVLPRLEVIDLKAQISLADGKLDIKAFSAKAAEGLIEGQGMLNATPGADVSATISARGLNLGRILKDLKLPEAAEGLVDTDLKVSSRGRSVAALMAAVDGHAIATMHGGRIHNGYLDLLGGDIASGLLKILTPVKSDKNTTAVNCLVSRLDIRNGMADTTVLVLDTELMSVVGDGRINLAAETLDLAFQPHAKKGVGGVTLNLGQLANPFRLTGTLANPALTIDKQSTALTLGKVIGSVAVLGPVGLTTLLIGKTGDQDPCPAALEAARTGVKPGRATTADPSPPAATLRESATQSLKQIGDSLKGLFQSDSSPMTND